MILKWAIMLTCTFGTYVSFTSNTFVLLYLPNILDVCNTVFVQVIVATFTQVWNQSTSSPLLSAPPPPALCLSAALCARCLLITSVTIVCVWVVRGTPLFTELFCAMKLKHCTALAMDTWIALTHAPIVLGPSVCRGFVPPHYASTNYFWLSLFAVWNESLTWFIFFLSFLSAIFSPLSSKCSSDA